MHMADALISPAVGAAFMAASAGIGAWSVRRLEAQPHDEHIPLMGVMGAFVFTAQMINFSIPGTGSSGHLGGGLLLAALLGPHAAFLTISAVLTVQALMFGDGGLLALGCNIFNLGFFPCFIAWPLVFRPLMGDSASRCRTMAGAVAAAILSLQAGAFSVVLQTVLSGRTELPFGTFVLLMQPIHLAIGVVEGLVTAAVVLFMLEHQPHSLKGGPADGAAPRLRRKAALLMVSLALLTGGILSSFASGNPDGLEWSMLRAAGSEELRADGPLHRIAAAVQTATAILPDYTFKESVPGSESVIAPGTAFSGLVGGAATLGMLSLAAALLLRFRKRSPGNKGQEAS